MKTFGKILVASATLLSLGACSRDMIETPGIEGFVNAHFGAKAVEPVSKATLSPDETDAVFTSAWENEDAVSLSYYCLDAEASSTEGTVEAKWSGSSFDATLPDKTGTWEYNVLYPAPTDSEIDFGGTRTQNGSAYNSKYDVMKGGAETEDAAAGKTDDGSDIVFQMDRLTGIVYFHLTSSVDETLTSATLSVEGDAIAGTTAELSATSGLVTTDDVKEIKLSFTEAPSAKDFKLWFNVLPSSYTSLTLTIETTAHKATISNSTAGSFAAGQLYKIAGDVTNKFEAKEEDKVFFYESFDKCDGKGGNDDQWSGITNAPSAQYDVTGWNETKVFGANACILLGSNDKQGKITSPALGLTSQSATLSFKAGAWNSDKETTTISVSLSKGTVSPSSITLTKGAWAEYTCKISGADETATVTFSASQASKNRFFLDEVCAYTGSKPVKKTVQTLSFGETTSFSLFVDETFTAPTLSGAKTDVTYSSSETSVATVDASTGAVTIVGAGSTEITATAAETDEYRSAKTSYKLTLSKRSQTLSFEKIYYSAALDNLDTFTSPKVSGAQTTVTYSITLASGTEEGAITINSSTGELTITKAGTATVTAAAAETNVYSGATAKYDISVTETKTAELKTVTYTVSTTTAVNTTGDAPSGSTATFKNTYTSANQITKDNSQTYTLTGYAGKTIKKVVLSMKSNASKGAGTFSLKAGSTTLAEISSITNFNKWFDNTAFTNSFKDVTVTLSNNNYQIATGESVVLVISCTTNSLYCQSVTITYEE